MISKVQNRIVKNKVVVEWETNCDTFTSVPQWTEIHLLNKTDGRWFSTFLGFLDRQQIAEIRVSYDLMFRPLNPYFIAINRRLRKIHTVEEAKKILTEVGVSKEKTVRVAFTLGDLDLPELGRKIQCAVQRSGFRGDEAKKIVSGLEARIRRQGE
jgi:hypothetical protein